MNSPAELGYGAPCSHDDADSPSRARHAVPLQWAERQDPYYLDSVCGRYRVSAQRVGQLIIYTAWRKERDGWEWMMQGPDAAHCRQICNADAGLREHHARGLA
jgi:hypothetical protein